MSYFIAALPRSRTAWLSVFMSQSGVYCHHDGFNGCNSMIEYRNKIRGMGDSSTGLTLIDLNQEFPSSRVVVIEKNKQEIESCIEWCDAACGVSSEAMILEMNEKLKSINGLKIKQSEIDKRLKDIWNHLTKAKWSDKYANLSSFHIESSPLNVNLESAKNLYASIQ